MRAVRDEANGRGHHELAIMVDGGIDTATAPRCAEAGANAFVAGTFLYRAADMAAEIARLRALTSDALQV
jgi:ribulose-phosphate 3-epimerase